MNNHTPVLPIICILATLLLLSAGMAAGTTKETDTVADKVKNTGLAFSSILAFIGIMAVAATIIVGFIKVLFGT